MPASVQARATVQTAAMVAHRRRVRGCRAPRAVPLLLAVASAAVAAVQRGGPAAFCGLGAAGAGRWRVSESSGGGSPVARRQRQQAELLRKRCAEKGLLQSGSESDMMLRLQVCPGSVRRAAPLRPPARQPPAPAAPAASPPPAAPRAEGTRQMKDGGVGSVSMPTRGSFAPQARTTAGTAKYAPPSSHVAQGVTPDFFKLPEGSLPRRIWQCESSWAGNHYEARGWRSSKGFTYVANVLDGITYLATSMDESIDAPPRSDCREVFEQDMSASQYAELVATLLQVEEDESKAQRWRREPSMVMPHGGYSFSLFPRFRYRGLTTEPLGGAEGVPEPHVAVTVVHEAVPPAEFNLGGLPATREMCDKLVGLKVFPAPTEKGETGERWEICEVEEGDKIALDEDLRQQFLGYKLTEKSRESWQRAPPGMLVLPVSRNCRDEEEFRLTYLASDLRPGVSERNQERLKGLPGWERWEPFAINSPEVRKISSPHERRQRILEQLESMRAQFGWLQPFGQVSQANPGNVLFGKLEVPAGVFGGGQKVSPPSGTKIITTLGRSGPFRLVDGPSGPPRLRGILIGSPNPKERQRAKEILAQARKALLDMKLKTEVKVGDDDVVECSDLGSLSGALGMAGVGQNDAVILFGSGSLAARESAVRERMKQECLAWGPDDSRHLASQWVSLPNYAAWGNDNKARYSLMNVCMGLLAKLGHAPFGIDISGWRSGQGGQRGVVVAGYDVCHLAHKAVHVAVGQRVETEDARKSVASRIVANVKRIDGETVDAEMLRKIVPLEAASGKVVFVHRDGRLPTDEVASWQKYYEEELKATGTTLLLIEIVKLVGGVPRMYKSSSTGVGNVDEGTFVQWSDSNAYIATTSGSQGGSGTVNPLNIHLRMTLGEAPGIARNAWIRSIFDLSYLHHGSVFKAPKLPMTTYFSDRLAYMVAKGDITWDEKVERRMSSSQQPWL
ncbi:unnamed protein product [Prorocentrum cordatum]|uniref:Piwi domain-containing protein n=1 Tax=Prorocentrum cordatum TaxID=2364126 RepID=A0ABN9XGZ4_9DINO|nr:unnamed protein product [Polarella glacialis]